MSFTVLNKKKEICQLTYDHERSIQDIITLMHIIILWTHMQAKLRMPFTNYL